MEFSDRELALLDTALVKYHNGLLDKRRKLRPSERAMMMADAKRVLNKVRAEVESRKGDE